MGEGQVREPCLPHARTLREGTISRKKNVYLLRELYTKGHNSTMSQKSSVDSRQSLAQFSVHCDASKVISLATH